MLPAIITINVLFDCFIWYSSHHELNIIVVGVFTRTFFPFMYHITFSELVCLRMGRFCFVFGDYDSFHAFLSALFMHWLLYFVYSYHRHLTIWVAWWPMCVHYIFSNSSLLLQRRKHNPLILVFIGYLLVSLAKCYSLFESLRLDNRHPHSGMACVVHSRKIYGIATLTEGRSSKKFNGQSFLVPWKYENFSSS